MNDPWAWVESVAVSFGGPDWRSLATLGAQTLLVVVTVLAVAALPFIVYRARR